MPPAGAFSLFALFSTIMLPLRGNCSDDSFLRSAYCIYRKLAYSCLLAFHIHPPLHSSDRNPDSYRESDGFPPSSTFSSQTLPDTSYPGRSLSAPCSPLFAPCPMPFSSFILHISPLLLVSKSHSHPVSQSP